MCQPLSNNLCVCGADPSGTAVGPGSHWAGGEGIFLPLCALRKRTYEITSKTKYRGIPRHVEVQSKKET